MKKFDAAVESIQSMLLKEDKKYKITIDTDQGDWTDIVNCLRSELAAQEHDNNYTIDAYAFVCWTLSFVNYSADGMEIGTYGHADGRVGRHPYASMMVDAYNGEYGQFAHKDDVLLFETKDYKQAFDAAVENITTAPEYQVYWDYDVQLQEDIIEAIRYNFINYCTSKTGQQLNAYSTYKLYQREKRDAEDINHVVRWLQIDVHAPSTLDVVKELTKDEQDDISEW